MKVYYERLPFPRWLRVLGAAIVALLGVVAIDLVVGDSTEPQWEQVVGGLGAALGAAAGLLLLLLRQHNEVQEDGTVTVGFSPLWRARFHATAVRIESADRVRGLEHGLGIRLLGNGTIGIIASPGPCVVLHGKGRRYLVRSDRPEDFITAVRSEDARNGRSGTASRPDSSES